MDNGGSSTNVGKYVDKFFDMLVLYDDNLVFKDGTKSNHDYKGLLKAAIDVFLNHQSNYTAYEVYQTFFMMYQITPEDKSEIDEKSPDVLISEPNYLLDLVDIMRKYEENTGELINWQRDHFIHSVNVFILGLAVYAQNQSYRTIFQNYILKNKHYKKYYRIDGNFSHEEFLYRWGVAALFHDIGYPFEIIGKQLDKLIEDGIKNISHNYDNVKMGLDFRDFDEFNVIAKLDPFDYADQYRERYSDSKVLDLFKPTDIMAHKLKLDFGFDNEVYKKLIKHLNGFPRFMTERDFVDHGFFSAILVLNSYGKLIQKYAKKDKDFFFYPIVDSATAILLHNYYSNALQKPPFNFGKLRPKQSPISYLLILCDELQEWNRQPYGVLDVKENHVNDLDVVIDDEYMKVIYILNNGPMGFGFSKKKDDVIDNVLEIQDIFLGKLSIRTKIELDNVIRDISIAEIQTPNILLRNVEKLARQINDEYNEELKAKLDEAIKKGDEKEIAEYKEKCSYLCDFEDLSADYKISNVRQAKSIPKKLSMIGCEIAHIDDERDEITKFDEKEIEDLAIFEHVDWCRERKGTGWSYGDVKNPEERRTPYLVSWEKLPDDIKDMDRKATENIPNLLNSIGLKVVRNKIRLLTFKMHQFYETGSLDDKSDGEKRFKELPKHVQYSNYKQADYLVKILKEKGFELVSLNDSRDKIHRFDEEDIEYFAKREHEGWLKLKLNLGYAHLPIDESDIQKIEEGIRESHNPNLVSWEDLDINVKKANKDTFINLPNLCDDSNVGLKIVRRQ